MTQLSSFSLSGSLISEEAAVIDDEAGMWTYCIWQKLVIISQNGIFVQNEILRDFDKMLSTILWLDEQWQYSDYLHLKSCHHLKVTFIGFVTV